MDIQGTLKTLVIKLNAKRCFNHECDSKYIVSCHVFDSHRSSISGPLELLGLFISNKRRYIAF